MRIIHYRKKLVMNLWLKICSSMPLTKSKTQVVICHQHTMKNSYDDMNDENKNINDNSDSHLGAERDFTSNNLDHSEIDCVSVDGGTSTSYENDANFSPRKDSGRSCSDYISSVLGNEICF